MPIPCCHRRLALACATVLAWQTPTDAAERARETGYQPLEILPSGHPVVEVSIDGSAPKRFVIDTGASVTAIMPRLRVELGGRLTRPVPALLHGAVGPTQVEIATIGEMRVAGYGFRSRAVVLLPPGPSDRLGTHGILGADVISNFAVEIDLPGRRWSMSRRSRAGTLAGLSEPVPFHLDDQRAVRLTVSVGGMEMAAVLDTGARETIVNWAAAKAIGISAVDRDLGGATEIRGATNHAMAGVGARLGRLSIGEVPMGTPRVRIADLPAFELLGFGRDEPAAILGIGVFADRRVVIDYPNSRMHIAKLAARPYGPDVLDHCR